MSDGVELHIEGLSDLDAALKDLGDGVERRVLAKAVAAGGEVLLEGAQRRAPRSRGTLPEGHKHMADTLVVQNHKTQAGEFRSVIGSVEKGSLLHLVEFGTAPHFQPKLHRQHPGTQAQPFLRPTIDEDGPRAVEACKEAMVDGVIEETLKAERRGGGA